MIWCGVWTAGALECLCTDCETGVCYTDQGGACFVQVLPSPPSLSVSFPPPSPLSSLPLSSIVWPSTSCLPFISLTSSLSLSLPLSLSHFQENHTLYQLVAFIVPWFPNNSTIQIFHICLSKYRLILYACTNISLENPLVHLYIPLTLSNYWMLDVIVMALSIGVLIVISPSLHLATAFCGGWMTSNSLYLCSEP